MLSAWSVLREDCPCSGGVSPSGEQGPWGLQSSEVMVSLTARGNLIDLCGVVRLMTQGVREDLRRLADHLKDFLVFVYFMFTKN